MQSNMHCGYFCRQQTTAYVGFCLTGTRSFQELFQIRLGCWKDSHRRLPQGRMPQGWISWGHYLQARCCSDHTTDNVEALFILPTTDCAR